LAFAIVEPIVALVKRENDRPMRVSIISGGGSGIGPPSRGGWPQAINA
jgi:hypothetical protein